MKPIHFKTLTVCTLIVFATSCNDRASERTVYNQKTTTSDDMSKPMADSVSGYADEDKATEESPATENNLTKTENKDLANCSVNVSSTQASLSSSAAKEPNDPNKKFVRTADLKFRVKEVVKSTQQIEDITGKFGGYVAYTNLESQQVGSSVEPYGEDSLIEVSKYQLRNEMVLRVPNTRLDSLLREIGTLVDHFDYRKIEAGDVTLQYEMNKRSAVVDRRVGGRIEDAIDSKVTLSIYEKPNVMTSVVVSDAVYQKYKPSFGDRFVTAMERSWNFLLDILLFFAQIWFLPFVGLVVYLIYRYNARKVKPAL